MNRHLLRRFSFTSSALALALIALGAASFWEIDAVDLPGVERLNIQPNESDIIAMAFLLLIPAFLLDRIVTHQRAHEAQLLAEQLRVLRVTMRTVQDIVNNNLNQLQLLRMEADGHVPDETLRLFDESIQDTATQLTTLATMEVFAEKRMASGLGLDVSTSSVPR
jgi:hypothetical protein